MLVLIPEQGLGRANQGITPYLVYPLWLIYRKKKEKENILIFLSALSSWFASFIIWSGLVGKCRPRIKLFKNKMSTFKQLWRCCFLKVLIVWRRRKKLILIILCFPQLICLLSVWVARHPHSCRHQEKEGKGEWRFITLPCYTLMSIKIQEPPYMIAQRKESYGEDIVFYWYHMPSISVQGTP